MHRLFSLLFDHPSESPPRRPSHTRTRYSYYRPTATCASTVHHTIDPLVAAVAAGWHWRTLIECSAGGGAALSELLPVAAAPLWIPTAPWRCHDHRRRRRRPPARVPAPQAVAAMVALPWLPTCAGSDSRRRGRERCAKQTVHPCRLCGGCMATTPAGAAMMAHTYCRRRHYRRHHHHLLPLLLLLLLQCRQRCRR